MRGIAPALTGLQGVVFLRGGMTTAALLAAATQHQYLRSAWSNMRGAALEPRLPVLQHGSGTLCARDAGLPFFGSFVIPPTLGFIGVSQPIILVVPVCAQGALDGCSIFVTEANRDRNIPATHRLGEHRRLLGRQAQIGNCAYCTASKRTACGTNCGSGKPTCGDQGPDPGDSQHAKPCKQPCTAADCRAYTCPGRSTGSRIRVGVVLSQRLVPKNGCLSAAQMKRLDSLRCTTSLLIGCIHTRDDSHVIWSLFSVKHVPAPGSQEAPLIRNRSNVRGSVYCGVATTLPL